MAKWVLNAKHGIQEEFIIDNNWAEKVYGLDIRKIDSLDKYDCKEIMFLIASDNEAVYSDLRQRLLDYVPFENICDLLSPSPYYDEDKRLLDGYMFLDNFNRDYLNKYVGPSRLSQLSVW